MNNSAINKAQETLEYLSQDPVSRAFPKIRISWSNNLKIREKKDWLYGKYFFKRAILDFPFNFKKL